MTLDDLGRAAAAKADEGTPEGMYLDWDDLCDADKGYWRDITLAVVERFAEEVAKELRQEAEDHEDAVVDYGLDRRTIRDHEQLRLAALTAAEHIEELLASLRDEAGQVK